MANADQGQGTRAGKAADKGPAIWVGYGKPLKLFRENSDLSQEALAQRIDYSSEQLASAWLPRAVRPRNPQAANASRRTSAVSSPS